MVGRDAVRAQGARRRRIYVVALLLVRRTAGRNIKTQAEPAPVYHLPEHSLRHWRTADIAKTHKNYREHFFSLRP